MSSKNTVLMLACLALGLGACTPKETTSSSEAGSSMAATSASSMSAPSGAPTMATTATDDPLPSHSEVAKKVRGEITKQNYKTELDKLEKEADQP